MRESAGNLLALVGALLTLVAAIGVVRFPDTLARMHALTKASALGFALVAIGAAVTLHTANDVTSALLAGALQLMTLPVAANLIARSAYWSRGIPFDPDTVDELHAHATSGAPGRRTRTIGTGSSRRRRKNRAGR